MGAVNWDGAKASSRLAEAAASIERHARELKLMNCYGSREVPPDVFGLDFVTDQKAMPESCIGHACYMLEIALRQSRQVHGQMKRRIRWCMREIKMRVRRRDKDGAVWLAGQIKKMIAEGRC